MKNKSLLWIIVFIAVTAVPAAIIYYTKLNNNFRNSAAPRPMWPKGIAENGKDTLFFKIPDYSAMNADSTVVSTIELDGKVTVIETFFSKCQSICPIMNKNLTRVFEQLGQNKQFQIFSYSVDYERDDLSTLRAYAADHGADLVQWKFLRSPQDSIFNFGRGSLKLPVGPDEEEGNFLHSERFILVDWNRNIRGYYDGTDSASVNKMMNHIVLLMSEKDRIERKKNRAK
jgi:protein SCO1/2